MSDSDERTSVATGDVDTGVVATGDVAFARELEAYVSIDVDTLISGTAVDNELALS